MIIEQHNGDLLTSHAQLICHQVNCMGVMGSGVALAIKTKWPNVYEEYKVCCNDGWKCGGLLGNIQTVFVNDLQEVVNLFAQNEFGYNGDRYTSYDALDECFKRLKKYCLDCDLDRIAIPYHMSSDRGGADWNVVLALLTSSFEDTNITIEIWKL